MSPSELNAVVERWLPVGGLYDAYGQYRVLGWYGRERGTGKWVGRLGDELVGRFPTARGASDAVRHENDARNRAERKAADDREAARHPERVRATRRAGWKADRYTGAPVLKHPVGARSVKVMEVYPGRFFVIVDNAKEPNLGRSFPDYISAQKNAESRFLPGSGRRVSPSYAAGPSRVTYSGKGREVYRWKRVDGMHVETTMGIVIEKKGSLWHWATEGGGRGTARTLRQAKRDAIDDA